MQTHLWHHQDLNEAIHALTEGEVVAFPTETVYGLGANAYCDAAVQKVYQAKGRPSDNPLIVHCHSLSQIQEILGSVSEDFQQLAEQFWPGPLTLIVEVPEGIFPKSVTGGLSTVAFRVPNHPVALDLLKGLSFPLVGPSANLSGKPSPTTAAHVLHDLSGRIAGVLDGGTTQVGVESTVVDLSVTPPMILRPGAITEEMLLSVLPQVYWDPHVFDPITQPKSPGMKYKHYAPDTPVSMVRDEDWDDLVKEVLAHNNRVGILADQEIISLFDEQVTTTYSLTKDYNISRANQHLFSGLRALDAYDLDHIFVQVFPDEGLGKAYMNRLKKAANQQYYHFKQ